MPTRFYVSVFALFLALAAPVSAAYSASGLKLPRFASLRAGEVNVRTGPGVRYPIEWQFVYRHMPIEIIAEFDTWRKVRDYEGTTGWVHQSMLSGRRSLIIRSGEQALRRDPSDTSDIIARLGERVVGRLLGCEEEWCRVEFSDYRGWLKRSQFWGVYVDEKIE